MTNPRTSTGALALLWTLGCGLHGVEAGPLDPEAEPSTVEAPRAQSPLLDTVERARATAEATKDDAATCPSQLGHPTLLFGSTVAIAPPHGVEFMPDDGNPVFAQAVMSGGFVSACDTTIKRVLVMAFADDERKSLEACAADLIVQLEAQGYAEGTPRGAEDTGAVFHTALDYDAAAGLPPTTLHIATLRIDRVYAVIFETSPDDYDTLLPTFRASAASLAASTKTL